MIEIPDGQYLDQNAANVMSEYLCNLPDIGSMVEIGTGMGHSTKFFATMKPNWVIYTIDGFGLFGGTKEEGKIFDELRSENVKSVFDYLKHCPNVIQILGDSNNLNWNIPVYAIYIDGTHTYESVKKDFKKYSPYLHTHGYIFFHDYHREDYGVRQFVNELCQKDWYLLYGHKIAVIKRRNEL